jgi:hypothetical protein
MPLTYPYHCHNPHDPHTLTTNITPMTQKPCIIHIIRVLIFPRVSHCTEFRKYPVSPHLVKTPMQHATNIVNRLSLKTLLNPESVDPHGPLDLDIPNPLTIIKNI